MKKLKAIAAYVTVVLATTGIVHANPPTGAPGGGDSGLTSYDLSRERGFPGEFREAVLIPMGQWIVESKPTRGAEFPSDYDFSDDEYAQLSEIVMRTPVLGYQLPETDLSLLQRMIERPELRILCGLLLIEYRVISDLGSAQDWLGSHHVPEFSLWFLHSRMTLPQEDWIASFSRYLDMVAGSMFEGYHEEVNAFMNLLWCRYNGSISPDLVKRFVLYTVDFDTTSREVEEMLFDSVSLVHRCSALSSKELIKTMAQANPDLARMIDDVFTFGSTCWYYEQVLEFEGIDLKQRPRSIWHTPQPTDDPYQVATFFDLLEWRLSSMHSDIQRRVLVSRIRSSILHSLEHAEVPLVEWMWTMNGYRFFLPAEIAESRHAYRIARSQVILDRLANYDVVPEHEPGGPGIDP